MATETQPVSTEEVRALILALARDPSDLRAEAARWLAAKARRPRSRHHHGNASPAHEWYWRSETRKHESHRPGSYLPELLAGRVVDEDRDVEARTPKRFTSGERAYAAVLDAWAGLTAEERRACWAWEPPGGVT